MNTFKKDESKIDRLQKGFLFRNTRHALKNPMSFLGDIAKSYGSIVYARIGFKNYIVLQDPEYIKHVLLDNHKSYNKLGITKILRFFFGEGLVTSNGSKWLKKRRLIQPAFHKKRLSNLLMIINEETTSYIKRLENVPSNSEINISKEMLQLNVSIVNRALFSNAIKTEIESMMSVLEELTNFATSWIKNPIKIPLSWPTPSNIKFKRNCKIYDDIIYRMIERRRASRLDTEQAFNNDLLDMLLDYVDEDSSKEMSDKQLRDEVTTIFMAGHDTTAQTLGWIFYEVSKNKGIGDKLMEESNREMNGRPPTLEKLRALKYSNMVIKEGLRCYPSIIAVQRKPIEDDNIDGLKISKGANLLINIYGMHHKPEYWQDPETFNPERFNDETEASLNPYVYLPFGAGPRLCIGSHFATMVMQVVLSRICEKFKFEIPENYEPRIDPNITIKAKDGIRLKVTKV